MSENTPQEDLPLRAIARSHGVHPAAVVALARSRGIAASGPECSINRLQVGRLESAIRAGALFSDAPAPSLSQVSRVSPAAIEGCEGEELVTRFTWNWKKDTLRARGFLNSASAMRAVERIALAADAVTVLSRRHGKIALRVVRGSLCVWLARDGRSPDRIFVVTAYVSALATPGDHANHFVREAAALTDFVTPGERLRLLPIGRA